MDMPFLAQGQGKSLTMEHYDRNLHTQCTRQWKGKYGGRVAKEYGAVNFEGYGEGLVNAL